MKPLLERKEGNPNKPDSFSLTTHLHTPLYRHQEVVKILLEQEEVVLPTVQGALQGPGGPVVPGLPGGLIQNGGLRRPFFINGRLSG